MSANLMEQSLIMRTIPLFEESKVTIILQTNILQLHSISVILPSEGVKLVRARLNPPHLRRSSLRSTLFFHVPKCMDMDRGLWK